MWSHSPWLIFLEAFNLRFLGILISWNFRRMYLYILLNLCFAQSSQNSLPSPPPRKLTISTENNSALWPQLVSAPSTETSTRQWKAVLATMENELLPSKYFANNSKNGTCELVTRVYLCISGRSYRTRNGDSNRGSTAIPWEKNVPLRRDCTSWPHYSSQRFLACLLAPPPVSGLSNAWRHKKLQLLVGWTT